MDLDIRIAGAEAADNRLSDGWDIIKLMHQQEAVEHGVGQGSITDEIVKEMLFERFDWIGLKQRCNFDLALTAVTVLEELEGLLHRIAEHPPLWNDRVRCIQERDRVIDHLLGEEHDVSFEDSA